MASWAEVEAEAPELAARARAFLDGHVHKTIATVRADGSPRISGIEAKIDDGELTFGSMPNSRKGADLRRDPRFALHSGSDDPPAWQGDAKLSGIAREVSEPSSEAQHFRADVKELSVVSLNEERNGLIVEFWKEGEGVRSISRR
ncbi:MAG TPA: pyridoxamine 5'-phosphate oxidase family protein [Solirubrobacterales bacterium]|nr:pyridoxamine 5'-phosphate oxidase family protein [Solirubrobacterales bacterium]